MKIKQVKINRYSRVMIICSYCDEKHTEEATYAILDQKFKYICHDCVSRQMSNGRNIEVMNDD